MFGAFKKTLEAFYKEDDRALALNNDIIWKPEESLWVAFISKDISVANLNKYHMLPFFLDKGYKVIQTNKGVRLTGTLHEKKIETVIGFNEKEDRMLHAKFSDEDPLQDKEDNITYFCNIFNDLADYLAENRCLRIQTYDPKGINVYKGETRPTAVLSKQEQALNTAIEANTFSRTSEAGNQVFTIFISKEPTLEQMIDFMLSFSGDQGLTCKMEGKSTVRSANSELVVTLKVGNNEKDMRMLEAQNQVSFLGGDKSGKVFNDFCRNLSLRIARYKYININNNNNDNTTPNVSTTPTVNPLQQSNGALNISTSLEKVVLSPSSDQKNIASLVRKGSSIELQRPGSRGSFLDLGNLSKKVEEVQIEETKIVVKTHIQNVATRNRNASTTMSMPINDKNSSQSDSKNSSLKESSASVQTVSSEDGESLSNSGKLP